MTRCGAGGKKRELRNIVRSSRFFLQPCCRSGWSRPTSGAQCSSGDCLLLCSGRPFAPSPRPRQSSGACLLLRYRPARSFPAPFPGRGAPFSAGTPSRPFRYRPARFFSAPFHGAGCFLSGLPVPLRDFRRYRAAANSLSRAISSGQRSSSGVSRMSGMPSKRASEAM